MRQIILEQILYAKKLYLFILDPVTFQRPNYVIMKYMLLFNLNKP